MKVIETVEKYVNIGDKIVVAVSGGKDSMSLLFALIQLNKKIKFDLSCITINHCIRGEIGRSDAEFVFNYCQNKGVCCKIVEVDVPKLAKSQKKTIEECARDARYKIFSDNVDKDSKLFIAHHASDQAETILMHILRGSGLDGAVGMQNRDNIVRPYLNVTKNEIEEFVKNNNIPFVEDYTNDDTNYTRNYIRKEIVPRLKQIYPNFETNILNFASICKEYVDIINKSIKSEWFSAKNEQICVFNDAFLQNNLISAKVIKKAYNMCGEYSDLESKHIQLIIDLLKYGKSGSAINITHGIIVEKRNEGLYFYKNTQKKLSNMEFELGEVIINNQCIKTTLVSSNEVHFGDGNLYVDYDKIPRHAIWRTRKDGDYFEKLGSLGKKKLNDYYTDKKITLKQRDIQILLAIGSEVLIVLPIDISNNVKVDAYTENIAKIELVEKKK